VDPLLLGVTGARARSMSPAEPVSQIPSSPVSLGPIPLLLGVGFQTEGPTFGPTLGNPRLRIDETRPRISESPGSREPFPSYEPANTGEALSRSLAAHPGSAQSAKQGRNGAASARLVAVKLCAVAIVAAPSGFSRRLASLPVRRRPHGHPRLLLVSPRRDGEYPDCLVRASRSRATCRRGT